MKRGLLTVQELILLLTAMVMHLPLKAQPGEAVFNGYCHSFRFLSGTASSAGLNFDMAFTSYDGRATLPLYDADASGYAVFSDEVLPSFSEPGVYRTDYVLYVNQKYDASGTITATLPTVDGDQNGIADFLQKNQQGNVSISGKLFRQLPTTAPELSFSGQIVRPAGVSRGTYSIGGRDPNIGDITYRGDFYLVNLLGKIKYNRTNTTATIEAEVERETGAAITYTSSLIYSIVDSNTISFPSGKFSAANQSDVFTKAFVLKRTGNRYLGRLDFEDANRNTSWPDFIAWQIEILDTNDSDGDGVPDLSDPPVLQPLPTILTQPVSQTRAVGETAILTVQALGSGVLSYSWRKDGVVLLNAGVITGASSPTLSIASVQASHAGNYSVIVSNSFGMVTSAVATLMVRVNETTSKASAVAVVRGGLVSSISVTDGGSGYLTEPLVLISGGGGSGATAKAFIENGRVVDIVITSSGSGYTQSPTVAIDAPSKFLGMKIELIPKLTIEGLVGQTARVEWAAQLSGPWTTWTNVVVGPEGTVLVDLATGAIGRFYRAVRD